MARLVGRRATFTMPEAIKKRLEIYAVLLVIGAGVARTFIDAKQEATTFRTELRSIRSEGVLRDSTDSKLVTTQLGRIGRDIEDIRLQQEVMKSDLMGMNVTMMSGAAEHAARLDGKVTVIQHQIADVNHAQAVLSDSLANLGRRVSDLAASVPDTVTVAVRDTIEVPKKESTWRKLIPGL